MTARIPGIGFLWNLAQGMDVRTWIREGLIDELQLDPLECAAGQAFTLLLVERLLLVHAHFQT